MLNLALRSAFFTSGSVSFARPKPIPTCPCRSPTTIDECENVAFHCFLLGLAPGSAFAAAKLSFRLADEQKICRQPHQRFDNLGFENTFAPARILSRVLLFSGFDRFSENGARLPGCNPARDFVVFDIFGRDLYLLLGPFNHFLELFGVTSIKSFGSFWFLFLPSEFLLDCLHYLGKRFVRVEPVFRRGVRIRFGARTVRRR